METQRVVPNHHQGGTSFFRTCFNTLNALSGVGLITIPYTLSTSGWLSIGFLFALAVVACYTSLLLKRCMELHPAIQSYPEIGEVAFGRKGKLIISALIYLELYLVPTGFLIMEGDNFHNLFPSVSLQVGELLVGGRKLFTIISGLVVLPTMWLRDLSVLSFVSASGVVASVLIICCVFWIGAFDGVGFSHKGGLFHLSGVPTSLSLYAFCYGAHPVFPTLYSSMEDKSRFSKVLLISFTLSTLGYIAMAICGYLMFGHNLESQVTLNLPTNKLASKIVIYTTLAIPLAKYALIISPIPNVVEKKLPNSYNFRLLSIVIIRTTLLGSTILVALFFPFFESLMALVGAILNVSVSIIIPCLCYLKISGVHKKRRYEAIMIGLIVIAAVFVAVIGTYSAVKDIIRHV